MPVVKRQRYKVLQHVVLAYGRGVGGGGEGMSSIAPGCHLCIPRPGRVMRPL